MNSTRRCRGWVPYGPKKVEHEAKRFAEGLLWGGEESKLGETIERFAARVGLPVGMVRYRVLG